MLFVTVFKKVFWRQS